ncbi:MAG: TolC family protein [Myxococcota bacterium]
MSRALVLVLLSGAALADEHLDALVAESLAVRPELSRASADVEAARARVPQVTAWSDPMLEVGVQNDGFTKWGVGTDPMSWVSFMARQSVPFPGKNPLRAELAQTEVRREELRLERARRTATAEMRRAYLALQAARERQSLLAGLRALWSTTRAAVQARYEAGQATQAELARIRLEESRLAQRARLLGLEEQVALRQVNRLRAKPLDTPVQTSPLRDFPVLPAHDVETSPELALARVAHARVEVDRSLRRRALLPDLQIAAGVMVRGPLEPMWTVTLGVPIPVFSGVRLLDEQRELDGMRGGAAAEREELEQQLAAGRSQREVRFATLAEAWGVSSGELIAQARTLCEAALSDYRTGRGALSLVLEANATLVAEQEAALDTLVEAWTVVIEQDELVVGGGAS